MKKTKLFGALALASCVMLSGCDIGKKKEEPTPDPTPAPEVSIVVSEDLPEYVVVGTEYDLDQYVTVTNTQTAYTVSLSEASKDLVTVDGHKVTPVAEGEISFTVSVGGKSATGSVESIYEIRKDFKDFSEGIVNNYAGFHLDYDTETQMVSMGGLMGHSSKYTFDEYFIEGEEGYTPGGYIDVGGKVYSYSLSAVEVGEEEYELVPDFLSFGDEPLSLSSIIGPFALQASDFEVLVGTEEEPAGMFGEVALFLPGTEENGVKLDKMFNGQVDASKYGYSFAGAYVEEFAEIELDDGSKKQTYAVTPLYKSSPTATPTYFLDTLFGFMKSEELEIEALDEFLESEETPEGKDISSFVSVIDSLAGESSFTVSFDYGGYLDDEKMSPLQAYQMGFSLGYNCTGTVNTYVTPNQIHVEEEGMEDLSFGYIVHDEKVYSYGDFELDPVEPIEITEPAADVEGKFPAHTLYSFELGAYEVEVNMPDYVSTYVPATEEDDPTYELDTSMVEYGALFVYVYSTLEEYKDFVDALLDCGWAVISETDPDYPNDYLLRFGRTPATLNLVDYSEDSEHEGFGYFSILLYAQQYTDLDGHYNATELTGVESLDKLQPYQNFSFYQSSTKIIDPETLEEFSVYDSIFANYVTTSTEEGVVTKSAEFSGETGLYLLYYMGVLSIPEAGQSDSRWTLANGINTIMYNEYHWDAVFTISYSYNEEAPDVITSFTISFRVSFGMVDLSEEGAEEPDYHSVFWGFDATFDLEHSKEIPEIAIEYPAEPEPQPEPQPEPEPLEQNID